MKLKAVIAGASGLIGNTLLNQLLLHPQYDEVLIFVRKEINISHKKLVQVIIDFDRLEEHAAQITGHAVFCCLGTTKSQTPDEEVYRKIDHDYPLQLAQMAKANGVNQYHLVSAIGANVKSGTFYLRTKGETERDIEKVGLHNLQIYQPSFLVGKRDHPRLGERIAGAILGLLDPLLIGGLKKYKSIRAEDVAWAMIKQSLKNEEGVYIHTSDKIKELA